MNAPFRPPRWSEATSTDPSGPLKAVVGWFMVMLVPWALALWAILG